VRKDALDRGLDLQTVEKVCGCVIMGWGNARIIGGNGFKINWPVQRTKRKLKTLKKRASLVAGKNGG